MTTTTNQPDTEPITLAPLPVPDAAGDIRQYTLMVANVFAALQEQMRLMRQQNEILEDIRDAVRGGRLRGDERENGVPHQLPANSPPPQVPRTSAPDDVPALSDAHDWLLSRLGMLGK